MKETERTKEDPVGVNLDHSGGWDAADFWKLWKEHEAHLFRICLHQLGGIEEEAEDALGVLMVKLLDLMPRYGDRIENLRAWLTRITYNVCIDIRRELQRKWNLQSIDELAASDGSIFLSTMESPEDGALRRESARYISQAIEELSLELRIPFLLHYLYDVPYNEIAMRLEISPENARKRGQLARASLQQTLENYRSGNAKLRLTSKGQSFDGLAWPPQMNALEGSAWQLSSLEAASPRQTAVRFVNAVVHSRVERSICLHLDHKPLKLYPKIEQIRRYTLNHPGGWKKRLELAQLLYEAGEWPEAIGHFQTVLERQPRLLKVYLDLADVFDLMGDQRSSIATYERALELFDPPAIRHQLKGLIEIRRRNYRNAVTEFESSARIDPEKVDYWHSLATAHLLRDSPLEALGSWNESLKINPGDEKALTYLPGLLRCLGRVKEAERYIDQSLTLHAENFLSLKSLIDYRAQRRLVFGKQGRRTLSLIKKALSLAPDSPDVHESHGFFHLCRGEWDRGLEILRAFAEQHELSPAAWRCYAKWLLRTGDAGNALQTIKRAQALDRESWKIESLACEVLSYVRATDLKEQLQSLIGKFPDRWSAWAVAGWGWVVGLNDPDTGSELSAQGIRLQPQLPGAWFRHSRVLRLANRFEEAIIAAEIGWRWLPLDEDGSQSVPAACRLAENCFLVNEAKRAEAWAREAEKRLAGLISLSPAEGSYWQGKLLELSGDHNGAVRAFEHALSHNIFYPKRTEVESGISRLKAMGQRARSACT